MARGHGAPYSGTFAAIASKILSQRCGRTVDFQNMATVAADVHIIDHRIPEALKLKPSVIVLLINSYDIQFIGSPETAPSEFHLNLASLKHLVTSSRLVTIGQHYLYLDPLVQLSVFLNAGADDAHGYVAIPLPRQWETRVEEMGAIIDRISAQAKAAHVPFVLVYAPRRAQVLLEMPKYHRANVDALELDRRLHAIAETDGVTFLDTTPSLASSKRYNDLFYISDGHPTVEGHAIIARDVASTLLTLPAFAGCDRSPLPMPS
jgi:lysophospholipase L1-like esterase